MARHRAPARRPIAPLFWTTFVAAVFVVWFLVTEPAPTIAPAGQTDTAYTVAGTLRCTTAGTWQVLDDGAHTPLGGLTVLSQNHTRIEIGYQPAVEVNVMLVGPDEQLARDGVTAGASVGLDHAYIYLGDRAGPRDPTPCGSTAGNLWVLAEFTGH